MATSGKPIFVATHPRACSTAFERVFMTRRDSLQCVHEPFGDAWYFGPERLAARYHDDEKARDESGFSQSTYKTIMDRINRENTEAKRIFIKDMAQYLVPPTGMPVSIAPSLLAAEPKRGVGTVNGHVNGSAANGVTNGASGAHFNSCAAVPEADSQECPGARYPTVKERDNPTVVPKALLGQFHFAFLIRHPSRSVPSYYRCCIPPLDDVTGFKNYRPDEAGYRELVELFDYLRNSQLVGPKIAKSISELNGDAGSKPASATPDICIIDADDLLDKPQDTIEAFCRSVGIDFDPSMLNWDTEEDHEFAKSTFEKWPGFHDDAINSKDLKPRTHARVPSSPSDYHGWVSKYGIEGADVIQKSVDENIKYYDYLKQFAIEV